MSGISISLTYNKILNLSTNHTNQYSLSHHPGFVCHYIYQQSWDDHYSEEYKYGSLRNGLKFKQSASDENKIVWGL